MKNEKFLILTITPFFLFAGVKEEITKFYKSHYPSIKIISVKSNKPFPKKYSNISFKLVNYKTPSSTLIIDGKYYFFTINATVDVYKAVNVIKVNEPIKPNVIKQSVKFRMFYSPPLNKINDSLVASKIISKNAVINKSNTKIKPSILKGETVSVIFKDKNIEIYAKGTALKDANKGDSVKVKIKSKTYTGTADDRGRVIVK